MSAPAQVVSSPRPPASGERVRGASEEILKRPAGAYLGSLRWDGPPGDPDAMPASAFLARL